MDKTIFGEKKNIHGGIRRPRIKIKINIISPQTWGKLGFCLLNSSTTISASDPVLGGRIF